MKSKKHSVKLRERKLANGNKSLFLDINASSGRKTEFLKLYLVKVSSPKDRENNRQTMDLAESVRAKRQLELKNQEFGFSNNFKLDTNFIDYFKELTNERYESSGNYGNWESTLKHLIRFKGNNITFKDVTIDYAEGFKKFLGTKDLTKSSKPLSQNSQHSYYNKLKATLNQAFEEGIIPMSPALRVRAIKPEETKREYLTLDELQKLVKEECRFPVLKNAFLFCCLTGIRWSDVNKLTWSDVREEGDGYRIIFRQKKTKSQEYLDIGVQAREIMGEKGELTERVFVGLKYSAWRNMALQKWVMKAGIDKDITFHCSRHTFAVLQMNLGTDIFTVSKLLGHANLKTTQIYAKIMDKKKQEAMNIIPNIKL